MLYEELMGVADAVPAISTASSLLSHAPCAAAWAVSEVLQNSRSWSEHLRSTKGKLLQQVQEAQHLAVETYEPYRRIYDYQRDWDKASFSKQPHTFESLSEQAAPGQTAEELTLETGGTCLRKLAGLEVFLGQRKEPVFRSNPCLSLCDNVRGISS
ncbi:unnamed protein product [Symbiodinium sp. CCMP2592]|nr:unnamed protein product [Symbiodinium sp. CCMP2592]